MILGILIPCAVILSLLAAHQIAHIIKGYRRYAGLYGSWQALRDRNTEQLCATLLFLHEAQTGKRGVTALVSEHVEVQQ
jgi:hypothetical protein